MVVDKWLLINNRMSVLRAYIAVDVGVSACKANGVEYEELGWEGDISKR
jgi:hypothetical protein